MPKRSSRPRQTDENVRAFDVVRLATGEEAAAPKRKNPAAVALGRLGGQKGGPARAASLTKAKRREIAQKAAKARWKGQRPSAG
jgi:hypothetical protein